MKPPAFNARLANDTSLVDVHVAVEFLNTYYLRRVLALYYVSLLSFGLNLSVVDYEQYHERPAVWMLEEYLCHRFK